MPDREKIVAVGFMTQPEFEVWGDRLRTVYLVDDVPDFDGLIRAIDEADARRNQRNHAENDKPQ